MEAWDLKPEEIKKILDKMLWSYSRVNAAGSCLYDWYKHYIEQQTVAPNCYGQFGTVCHETWEKFLKGELNIFTASQYYQERYPEIVTCSFPPNKYKDLGESSYLGGKEHFDNISFDFNKYEVLGVEKELRFNVGKYPFQGYADAVFKNKETGEIILCDHKTSSFKYLKNGDVSKKDREHFEGFKRQEYLYCIPLIEEYGKVDKLSWNMIRDNKIIEITFNETEFNEAQEWAIKNIQKLENEVLWLPDTSNSYYCNVLCGSRNSCTYRK